MGKLQHYDGYCLKKRQEIKMSLQEIKAPAHVAIFSYVGDVQGCGTIRVIYPSLLLNQYRINQYAFTSMYNSMFVNDPRFYKPFSFVQFQRSATKQHMDIFNHYLTHIRSQLRTPIIYEIDDMLFGIPEWNYAHSYYKPNDDIIKKMMGMVDGMITSTEKLKEVYSPFTKKVTVIPNHLPKFVWGEPVKKLETNPRELKDRPRIGWAGSENHFAHPMTKEYKSGVRGGDFNEKLIDFIRKTADKYQWVLSGAKPVELNDLVQEGKIEFHGWKSTFEYPRHIRSLDLDICLAPLLPCEFNDCKSNIKSLEFAVIGVPGVYSSSRPYLDMTLNTNDEDEFISNIEMLTSDVDKRKEVYYNDFRTVEKQIYWEEHENLFHYINSYLLMFGKTLKAP